jgi:hypothetical protein
VQTAMWREGPRDRQSKELDQSPERRANDNGSTCLAFPCLPPVVVVAAVVHESNDVNDGPLLQLQCSMDSPLSTSSSTPCALQIV